MTSKKMSSIAVLGLLLFSSFSSINSGFAQLGQTTDQSYAKFIDTSTKFQLYNNTQYGFSIQYPQAWHVVEHLDKTYTAKTVMISPDENLQFNVGVIQDNNPYAGLTNQEILGQITTMMRNACSGATVQSRGFACTAPQFNTNVTDYRGVPVYHVGMTWTKTFSDGSSIKWASIWGLMPTANDVWFVIMESSFDEFVTNMDKTKHMYDSLDISDIQPTVPLLLQDVAPTIPRWIKNAAKWWAEGSMDDSDFIKDIQYLVQQGIIVVPATNVSSTTANGLPSWVKNTARWWSEDQVGDSDFVQGIQYLVQNGIISVHPSSSVPQVVTYVNRDGVSMNVLAIPDEVVLLVTPGSVDSVNNMISSNGGTAILQDPGLGFYVVRVDNVRDFISSSYRYSFVINAFPNKILSEYASSSGAGTQYADLTKTSWNNVRVPPSAKVIVVQIDDFVYAKQSCNGQNLPHGVCVSMQNNLLSGGAGDVYVIHLQDRYGPGSSILVRDVLRNMQDAVSIAEKYQKKLVINLSLGAATSDENGRLYTDAEQRVKDDMTGELDAVMNMPWFQKGNVVISKAAPNDPVDLSKINRDLQNDDQYGKASKSYIVTSQTKDDENGNQKLTTFVGGSTSAYGNGVVFVKREDNCGGGTSCAVYGTTAVQSLMWSWYPGVKSDQLVDLIKSNTKIPSGGKYPVVDIKGAFMSAWQQYKCITNCPNFGQTDNNINHLGQSQQSSGTQTAPGSTKTYGGYSTAEGYCQGTYGSTYHYDSSTNTCRVTPSQNAGQSGGTQGRGTGIDLTGQWSGTARGTVVFSDSSGEQVTCALSGSLHLSLQQSGKSLGGDVSVSGISLSGSGCEAYEISSVGGQLASTIFGSGFSGTVDFLSVSGQFTSDLVRGTYSGDGGGYTISGDFTASRVR